MDITEMALKKHFANACKKTEVAVNLEGRVSAEKIIKHGVLYKFCNKVITLVALKKSCIAENSHSKAPACTLVASVLESCKASVEKLFVCRVNLSEGI